MDNQQRILLIDTVLPILNAYIASGFARMNGDEKETVKSLVAEIFGVYNIDASCQSCVIHYLYMLQAYRGTAIAQIEREKELTRITVEEIIIPEATTTEEFIEKVKAGKKPKSCCKNK